MALGDDYVTLSEFKSWIGDSETIDDATWTFAISAASRGIEKVTGRQFNQATVATARVYRPELTCSVAIDDFHTTTDLLIETDEGGDGAFDTTWTSVDFELEPLNGVVDGEQGWPFNEIRAVGSRLFRPHRRASVRVTAQWGWPAPPAAVKTSCLIAAAEIGKMKDAPFGVAGFDNWGAVRVRDNPMAVAKLAPYIRHRVMVG